MSFRNGEPADHFRAKSYIADILNGLGYMTQLEYPLVNSLAQRGYKHNYDVVGFGKLVVVEVDDPSLHAKPIHVKNDRVAEGQCLNYFPKAKFFRLVKQDINHPNKQERDGYLLEHFLNEVV